MSTHWIEEKETDHTPRSITVDELLERYYKGESLCPACIQRVRDAVMEIASRFGAYLEKNQF